MKTVYTVILWLILGSICGVWSDSHSLTETCMKKYNLSSSESGHIVVRVKKNSSFCKKQLSRPGIESQTEDLKPRIDLPYLKNGEYFFNITWQVAMYRNKKFPKFAMYLKYLIPEQNVTNQECIVFKLRNTTALEYMGKIRMYFDCVKVQDSIDTGEFSLQLWQINCDRSRGKRSSSSCGQITQSRQTHHSLALDDYKHAICSCYYSCGNSKPISNITAMYEGGSMVNFKISVANLPSFTRSIIIRVSSSNGKSWEYSTNKELTVANGSLTFITNLDAYTVGTVYTITMYYECMSARSPNTPLPSTCFSSDKYLLDNSTGITYVDIHHQQYHREIIVVLAVTAGTIAIAVTVIALLLRMRRIRQKGPSQFDIIDTTIEDMTRLIQRDTEIPCIQLYHPDIGAVYQHIIDKLTNNGIVLKDGREGNWREFSSKYVAKSVSERARINIIIFMTDGLFQLLYGDSELKNKRLVERQYENVPDMVFRELQTMTDDVRKKVILHVISLNTFKGRQHVQELIDNGKFHTRQIMLHTYYFQSDSLNCKQNQHEANRLTENIHSQ